MGAHGDPPDWQVLACRAWAGWRTPAVTQVTRAQIRSDIDNLQGEARPVSEVQIVAFGETLQLAGL